MALQQQQDKIGWIGLGEMGAEMASNLHKYLAQSSAHLTVWNRSVDKTTRLAQLGATVAPSIEAVFASSNIIFTSLANDAAVEAVYATLLPLAAARKDRVIFVETSTVYPTLPTKLHAQLQASSPQHIFLQCPVFGRPPAAAAAQLVWVASGNAEAIAHLTPYFNSMARTILDLHTEEVSRACAFKLVGNFFVVGTIELLAEGLTLGNKNGVASADVLKLVELMFPSPVWVGYSKLLAAEDKPKAGGFSVNLGLKDVGHMQRLAEESGAQLPTAELARRHLAKMKEEGCGEEDWSAMIKALQ
ncbi:hypothetical protein BGZ52_000432 [Haplosporangium bisporale]|nr:hypothetical protein BGZ52_000432 [Haplosporangium bisporale]KAI9238192.1 MAG: 3-hydroxyisobutyrate dehydrogenase family protein [Podila humilis]KFH67839.1 hypothetical protein MVEG_06570 [Podila verticillata NRRL 6337]